MLFIIEYYMYTTDSQYRPKYNDTICIPAYQYPSYKSTEILKNFSENSKEEQKINFRWNRAQVNNENIQPRLISSRT